jgi:hypothetical protein
VPEEERRRVEDLETTTYSTETGEKVAESGEEKPRRRPRRKRRPRPEVIAQHLKVGDEDGGDDEGEEE